MARHSRAVDWTSYKDELYLVPRNKRDPESPYTKPLVATHIAYEPDGAPLLASTPFSKLTVPIVEAFYDGFVARQKATYGKRVFHGCNNGELAKMIAKAKKGKPQVYVNAQGYFSSGKTKLVAYLEQCETPSVDEFRKFVGRQQTQLDLVKVMEDGAIRKDLAVLAGTRADFEACVRKFGAPEKKKKKKRARANEDE